MRYRCKACGAELEVPGDVPPERCPLCGAEEELPEGKKDGDPAEAWKLPLYERATGMPQDRDFVHLQTLYLFLGDYRDSATRLRGLNESLEKRYQQAILACAAAATEAELKAAIDKLKPIAEYRDCSERIESVKARLEALRRQREEAAAAERARLEALARRRKRIWKMILVGLFTMIAVSGVVKAYRAIVIPNRMLAEGDAAREAGDYKGALARYREAIEYGAVGARARESVKETYAEWGDALFGEGRYGAALEKYDLSSTASKRRELSRVMVLLKSGDYSSAAAICSGDDGGMKLTAGDFVDEGLDTSPDRIRALWCDQLFDEGDVDGALEAASGIDDDGLRSEKMQALVLANAGDRRWLGALTAEQAGSYGAVLTGIDEQLRYCRLLWEAGFDLHDVYPHGVEVELAENLPVRASGGGAPNADRVAVLWRRSDAKDGAARQFWPLNSEDDTVNSARKGAYTRYVTRLLPGATYALGAEHAPASWEDCTAVLVVDQLYEPRGVYQEEWYNENITLSTTPLEKYTEGYDLIVSFNRCYLYFGAWSAVQLFDRQDPSVSRVFDSLEAGPNCADAMYVFRVGEAYRRKHPKTDLKDFISPFGKQIMEGEDMTVTFDGEWAQAAFERAMASISEEKKESTS